MDSERDRATRRRRRRRKVYSGANAVNEEDPEGDRVIVCPMEVYEVYQSF